MLPAKHTAAEPSNKTNKSSETRDCPLSSDRAVEQVGTIQNKTSCTIVKNDQR
jgi:hypothetical protein